MIFQPWQIGLDIQNGKFCAIAIQPRRYGWQLRHWWQYPLPENLLDQGGLSSPEILVSVLKKWRLELPRQFSLRVGFPPQAVLQRQIPSPPLQLQEPALSRYVAAVSRKAFPVMPENLVLDYRAANWPSGQINLTAAHKTVLSQWINCFERAKIMPDIIELTQGALGNLGQFLLSNEEGALIHKLTDHWLWCVSDSKRITTGWATFEEIFHFNELRERYFPSVKTHYFSSSQTDLLPEGTQPLLPFKALTQFSPPLPDNQGEFSLAVGLALRPGDY